MRQLRTLVVDDEPLAMELVAGYVRQVDFLSLAGCYSSVSEAKEALGRGEIDVVFLDIQMPGVSGLALAKSLGNSERPKVVFTTAYDEYAIEGFKLGVVDYLLKPFDLDEFKRAAAKARRLIELEEVAETTSIAPFSPTDSFFFVKSDYKLVKIEYDHICYIEGLKDYVKIYQDGQPKPILTIATMKQMEARLAGRPFLRLHKSFIVNIRKVSGVERGGVFVGNVRIPVGDGFKQNLHSALEKLTL